jgi:rare lipoprotein A (peptidoglycan hydrolase)
MLCTIAAFGQQSWQGNAAVARSGEFDTPGMYAASNAFAENTDILVQNAQTRQSVRVTVTQRIPGTASVFLLLSEEAGKQIGLTGSQIIRVQASLVSTPGTDLEALLREEVYSPDPDLNPAVSVAQEPLLTSPEDTGEQAETESPPAAEEVAVAAPPTEPVVEEVVEDQPPEPVVEEVSVEEVAAEEEQPPEPVEQPIEEPPVEEVAAAEEQPPEPEEQPTEEPPATEEVAEPVEVAQVATEEGEEPEQEPTAEPETPATAQTTAEEKRLQELADRIPQKQLYMPPRQQEVYALAPEPSVTEEVEEEIATVEEPTEEVPEEVVEEVAVVEEEPPDEEAVEEIPEEVEEGPPGVSMLGPEVEEEPLEVALPGPQATEPEKPSPEGTRLPAPEEESPLAVAPEEPPTIEEAVAAEEAVEPEVTEEQPSEEVAVVEEEVEAVEEEPPAAEVAMTEAAPAETTVLSDTLPSQTYFVQLGAYSTRSLAEKLAGDLTQRYSVTILPASSAGRHFYKVLVGPLNVDESGTLLYQFRSRGFKDAFIQFVE